MDDNQSKIIESAISSIGKEVYKDGLKPATQKLGESLRTVAHSIDVLFFPLRILNYTHDEVREWLLKAISRRLESVEDQKLVTPNSQAFSQAITGLCYCYEEQELREMFANLIAASMCEDTTKRVHPSFASVIQQLSGFEASLIKILNEMTQSNTILSESSSEWDYDPSWLVDVLAWNLEKSHSDFVFDHVQLMVAIDNLQRLQLIVKSEIPTSEYVAQYADKGDIIGPKIETSYSLELAFTDYGYEFVECCVESNL